MRQAELIFHFVLVLALSVLLAAAAWRCWRRSGSMSFLMLGAVLVLWPWFEAATNLLQRHFVDQVMGGQRPWLFPFSLMAPGGAGTGWQMTPGEFAMKVSWVKQIIHLVLLLIPFIYLARFLGKESRGFTVIRPSGDAPKPRQDGSHAGD